VKQYAVASFRDFVLSDGTALFADDLAFNAFIDNTLEPRARQIIDDYCKRSFGVTTATTEKYDSTGFDDRLKLRNGPVTVLTAVDILRQDGTVAETMPSSDYRLLGDRTLVFRRILPRGWQNIRVQYTYGYATVPTTVADVATRVCANMLNYMKINKMGAVVRDPSAPSGFGLQIPQQEVLTQDLRRLLDPYVKTSFGWSR